MPFTWKDATSLGIQIMQTLISSVEAGLSREEAIREATTVLARRDQIDSDVAEEFAGPDGHGQ